MIIDSGSVPACSCCSRVGTLSLSLLALIYLPQFNVYVTGTAKPEYTKAVVLARWEVILLLLGAISASANKLVKYVVRCVVKLSEFLSLVDNQSAPIY